MLFLNLKLAFRNLVKNKVYSFLIIGGFAIGFAACILIALFYHRETTVNHEFANHQRIYRIYDVKRNGCNLSWDMYPVLAKDFAAVEDACPFDYMGTMKLNMKDVETGKYCEIKNLLSTTSDFFKIFSVKISGSLSGEPFEGNESVAISSEVAKSLFGDKNPLGRKISLENYFFGTITSVFEILPANSSFSADLILNSQNKSFRFSTNTTNGITTNPTNLFIQIKGGTFSDTFQKELNTSDRFSETDADSLALQSLDDIYLSTLTMKSGHAAGNANLLRIFIAISGLILILSSINYINYSISIQYARFRYTGIKKVFGANRENLVTYTIAETATGIIISLVIALLITDAALSYSEKIFVRPLVVSLSDWLAIAPVVVAVTILIILLNSLGSIYMISKFSLTEFLSGLRSKSSGKQIWKQSLLVFQLTVSVALISIVIVIFSQLGFFMKPDPGFNMDKLVRITIPMGYKQTDALRSELSKLPFVMNSTLSIGCPGMINMRSSSTVNDVEVQFSEIDAADNYINTMGHTLVKGRDFLPGDLGKACLINEEAFRQLGWDSIQGHSHGGKEVIGILKNFRFESGYKTIQPLKINYLGAKNANVLSLRLGKGSIKEQSEEIRKVWNSISPFEPFNYVFFDDFYKAFYTKEKKLAGSISLFALIAIALTCMGILGHILMVCLTRVKEIGIRKINGATVSEILLLINRDFLKWFAIAFIIATPVAWIISRKWLSNFAYRITPGFWLFAIGGLIALLILLITVSWQSWKAATRNPVEALRYE